MKSDFFYKNYSNIAFIIAGVAVLLFDAIHNFLYGAPSFGTTLRTTDIAVIIFGVGTIDIAIIIFGLYCIFSGVSGISPKVHETRKYCIIKSKIFYASNKLLWIIILFGIILRLDQYLFNRSLWLDESFIALNIVNRSFSQLLLPLDYDQAAPIGFLIVEKVIVGIFGNNEYALRLFPLLSGIISLFLFYNVGKYFIKANALPIALGLFAISSPLIYYSSEVKQYSSDLAIGLLLYSVTIYIISKKKMNFRNIAIFGGIGAIVIWFSYTSIFVLSGIGITYAFICLKIKDWSRARGLLIIYFLWGLSLAIYYLISLRNLGNNQNLNNFWIPYFMPFPPDTGWLSYIFFTMFDDPVGLSITSIAALTFILGCISLFFESKEKFGIMISPVLITLLVSGFHLYPFGGRAILFIVPSLILFIAEGALLIRNKTMHNSVIGTIGIILLGVLFFQPIILSSYHLIEPISKEEIKPVMNYLKEHYQYGDSIYLYYWSQYAFKYYSKSYGLDEKIYGIFSWESCGWENPDNRSYLIEDLDKLRGKKRVWILFSHVYKDDDKVFIYYLNNLGTELESFKNMGAGNLGTEPESKNMGGASVYLYNIS